MGNFSSGQPAVYQLDKLFEQKNSHDHSSHHSTPDHHDHHSPSHRINLSQQNLQTIYSGFTSKQDNLIWTGVSSVSYNDFKRLFLHNQKLSLKSSNIKSTHILNALNISTFNKTMIPQCQIYLRNGEQAVHLYHTHTKRSTSKTFIDLKQQHSKNQALIYGCLIKSLSFQSQIQRSQRIEWHQTDTQGNKQNILVDAIGFKNQHSLKKIKLIKYKHQKNPIIGFKIDNQLAHQNYSRQGAHKEQHKHDVVYIIPSDYEDKSESIQSTINKIMKIQDQKPISQRESSKKLSKFTMPVIRIDETFKYECFNQSEIQNKDMKGKNFQLIEQIEIQLKVEQIVHEVQYKKCEYEQAGLNELQISINTPYWLVLCRQGRHPYLVSKINNLSKK